MAAGGSLLGRLRVQLGLDSTQFQEGLKGSNSALVAWGKRATLIAAGIATAGAAAFAGFSKAANSLSELQKQADIAGMGVEQFKIAALAVEQYGISQEKLSDILKDVNDKIGDFAATGGGELKDFFENVAPKVGLTIEAFEGLSSSDALALYVTALKDANVSQAEMTFYMEALANDATALVPAFQNGGQAIKDMAARAKELGLSIDEGVIASARAAQTDVRLMSEVIGIQLSQAMIKLGPAISQVVAALTPMADIMARVIQAVLDGTDAAGRFVREGLIAIRDELASLPGRARAEIDALNASLREGLGLAASNARAAAQAIVTAIVAGLAGLYQAGVDAVAELARGLRESVSGLIEEAKSWGANVGAGLVEGLQGTRGAARRGAKRLWDEVSGAFTAPAEIQSPSRVFMRFGQYIADGLAIGIEDGAKGPVSAMQDMASGLSDVFKGMLFEGRSFGDSMKSMLSSLFSGWASSAFDSGFKGIMGALGLPSFAGGGFTGYAPRSGGLDGRGGFLALMHPRETVTDHTLGQGGPQEVRVMVGVDPRNGNITAYADQRVARGMAQVRAEMPSIMDDHQKRVR